MALLISGVIFPLVILAVDWVEAEPLVAANRPLVRVRADATVQSVQIGQLKLGEEVELLGRKDEWLRIRLEGGQLGWVNSFLAQERLLTKRGGIEVRSDHSAGASIVATLDRDQELSRLSKQGKWVEVDLGNGQTGWIEQKYLRAKTSEDRRGSSAPNEPVTELSGLVRRNPYAEGLQYKAAGEYRKALASFEEVLAVEPDNYNALIHAAQSQKQLQDYDGALAKLYGGLERNGGRRELYMTLGEVYRVKGQPDSARKYTALYKGEEYLPDENSSSEEAAAIVQEGGKGRNLFAAVGVALCVLIGGALLVAGKSRKRKRAPKQKSADAESQKDFEQTLEGTKPVPEGPPSPGISQELDRQLETKWRQLRQETGSGLDGSKWLEEKESEQLEGQLEVLRQALSAQGERERLYADLLEMQRQKIEAMSEEIRLLRKRRPKP